MTIWVGRLSRRILAVRNNVTCYNSIVYGKIVSSIWIDESFNNGIIISTLQIVQPNLFIKVVRTITEGVDICNANGIQGNSTHTPRIVGVSCHSFGFLINNSNYVALKILDEVIGNVVVEDTANAILVIVERNESIAIPSFAENFGTICVVFGYAFYTVVFKR